jgi:hypothetical protein
MLSQERLAQMRLVVEHDREHVGANRGLGHVRRDGRWTTADEMLASRGFVKHKGKRVLPQELELTLQEERIGESEKSWLKRVKMWQGWLAGGHGDRRATAVARLNEIHDPDAVPALVRSFRDAPEEQHRLLYVSVLSKIEGERPVFAMVVQSLVDDSKAVREMAITGIRRKEAAPAIAVYLRALKNRQNPIVNRAAEALGQLGHDGAIAPLIEALITRHEYQMLVRDTAPMASTQGRENRSGVVFPPGFGPNTDTSRLSSSAPNSSVQAELADGLVPVIYEKDQENQSVLLALNLLTRQNFSYDAPAWRRWNRARSSAAVTRP